MKTDDPKFTAYALDELEPAERAEVDALLVEEPALSAELDDLRAFAAKLRTELHAEEGAPLTTEQRAELLGAVPRVVAIPRVWWRRPWVQSAAAACVIIGVSAALLSRTQVRTPNLAQRGRISGEIALNAEKFFREQEASGTAERLADAAPVALAEHPVDLAARPSAPSPTVASNSADTQLGLASTGFASAEAARAATDPRRPVAAAGAAGPSPEVLTTLDDQVTEPLSSAGIVKLDVGGRVLGRELGSTLGDARSTGAVADRAEAKPAIDATTLTRTKAKKPAGPSSEFLGDEQRGALVGRTRTVTPAAKAKSNTAQALDLYASAPRLSAAAPASAPAKDGSVSAADASQLYARSENRLRLLPTEELGEVRNKREVDKRGREDRYHFYTEHDASSNTEVYENITDNAFLPVKEQPLSTFSIDVDSASYANVRRFLNGNQRPPRGAVRIEELVNYFRYDYPQPDGADPFSCALEVATCPWQTDHRLVRIGLKGKEIKREARPPANLVFLVDVSGSMAPENRLPLVKQCLRMLVDQLTAQDTVAIAVYAGASGCVLEPTSDRTKIREALDRLDAGGSTNGAAGIQLAYDLAQRSFKKGGTNRVILCTDGDFNVGITNQSELVSLVQGKAKTSIFLSVLGFGMGNLKDSTLEKLADKGNGNYAYIDTLNEGRRVFVEQMSGTLITIAKDVKVQVEFNPAQVGAYRLIGYENRLLAKEDFNDDTKDAGEIGAGHTVTAFYEVVPAGKAVPAQPPGADELKYQAPTPSSRAERSAVEGPGATSPALAAGAAPSRELLTVKLRYKQPEGDVSKKLDFPLTDSGTSWEKSSGDFRWAASVASFGLLLRDSPHKGSANWSLVEELAAEGKGDDRDGYRTEFVGLVEKAKALSR